MTENEYRDQVYEVAEKIGTPDEFVAFILQIESHEHDYGTIVYACSAAAIAGFNVMNRSKQGGITGFQAGCLMWEMVRKFGMFSEGPLRIQDFDQIRYPQYDDKWPVRITPASAAVLQERARKMVDEQGDLVSPAVLERNREISAGKFPGFVTVAEDS